MGIFDKYFTKDAVEQKSETELWSFVHSKLKEARDNASRVAHEAQWLTNVAYYLGFSGLYFDSVTRSYLPLSRNQTGLRRDRMQSNFILPILQNRAARINRNRPKWQVRPNKNDNEDIEACRLGEQVLDYVWHRERIDSKRFECSMWRQQIGHSYLKVVWDPTLGEEVPDPDSAQPQADLGEPNSPSDNMNNLGMQDSASGPEMMSLGDIRVDVVSGFEVFVDPLAMTERDCQWLIHARTRPLSYFRNQYENGEEVKEEGLWLLSQQYQSRINNMTAQGPSNSGVQSLLKDCAIEVCYYEAKSKKYPKGRLIIAANGIILEEKELPCGKIPFIKFDDIFVAGKYYPESLVTHLRPLQDQKNRLLSFRSEWTNMLLRGKYIAARGHGLAQEALNDRNAEVVEYDEIPGHPPPQALQAPIIPAYAYTEEQAIDKMANDISGLSEVSRGTLPAGAGSMPAIGMQMLTEADETRLSAITKRDEEAFARLGELILRYVGEYYKTPRLLKIAGPNLQYTIKSFEGVDLRNNYDVNVIEGSTLPESVSQKRADVGNLLKMGLLGDPQDPKVALKIMKMMEFGDTDELYQDYGLDMHQIQESIERLSQGIPDTLPPIPESVNNRLHIQEKNRFTKTEKFRALAPAIQNLFWQDMEMRIQAMMRAANPQIASEEQLGPQKDQLAQQQAMTNAKDGLNQQQMAQTSAVQQKQQGVS